MEHLSEVQTEMNNAVKHVKNRLPKTMWSKYYLTGLWLENYPIVELGKKRPHLKAET